MSGERPLHERTDGQLLAAAAAAVARGDDLDDSLAELLGLTSEHLGATSGAVYILDRDRDELELAVTFGVDTDAAAAAGSVKPVSGSHDPLADVNRSRQPLEIDDAAHVAILRGAKTALLLPLVVRREGIEISMGVMGVGFPGSLPAHEILTDAESLADLAAVAVERALALSLGSERAEWFDRLAHTDPLTGLGNRRTLDSVLELEVARAGRQGVPLSIAILEIDRFSEIQKRGGNVAGDEALRLVAQILSESVRLMDTIARYANEQFILVAPGPDGLVVAERLVRSIAGLAPIGGHAISVSAGIAGFPLDGRTPEELLAVAEKAMRAARQAGGDRVVTQAAPAE
ncbi:MAG: diguanylate cyclase domain-containing protein [Candidatus Limnocylindrales bacterium]